MKIYTLILAMLGMFLVVSCDEVTDSQEQQQEQQQQEEVEQMEGGVVAVWTLHEEMTSGLGDEIRDGTATFYDDRTVRIRDGVVDITYDFEYYDDGATIELTNVEMAEDVMNFMVIEENENKQVWENLENDVQSVWTMTKE